jgi:hypothetical protein
MTDIQTVRRELAELAEWTPLLPATPSDAARVRGAGMGSANFGPKRSASPAPGNVDRYIDTWLDNGPLGIHTQCGVHQAFGHWVDEIREWRASTIGPERLIPGDIPYLLAHLDWAQDHMPHAQWDFLAADIAGVHGRVQHLVHPDRLHEGTCPTCGARIEWILGDHGKINLPICPNHHTIDNLDAATLRRLRAADQDDAPAYATMKEVQQLFPTLKGGTLRKWVFEEKVRKEGSRYCVNDIATRMASTQPAA